jgi:hypothetical protein
MSEKAKNLYSFAFMFASWAFALQVQINRGAPFNSEIKAHEIEYSAEREFLRPEWLNDEFQAYYDEVEIFINYEYLETGGMCYITRFGDVYINWGLEKRWSALVVGKACMAHEVGHWIDRQNDSLSQTTEFQEAIDLAARMDWGIDHFPCISGKPCQDGEWGGYGEIYADLFERESITDIPAILWDWYLLYYR